MRVIEKAMKIGIPYLAVLPDVPGEGHKSLDLSMQWLSRVPSEYPWYLAVQDGMCPDDIETPNLSGIFLGGTNSYKHTAGVWKDFAHENGLKFHYGRCGTQSKIAHARHIGADSIDSALPMWTKKGWALFKESIVRAPPQIDCFYENKGD